MTPRSLLAFATALATALTGLVLALPSPAHAAKRDEVWLKFESAKPGKRIVRVGNSGKTKTTVSIRKRKGGVLIARKSRNTKSRVAEFPDYSGVNGPRAVVAVLAKRGNPLAPRSRPFTIGVDFKVDEAAIAPRDDGNNLLQRGNHASPSQYKLQVDDGHIECRMKGREGAVLVTAPTPVSAARWYRVACSLVPLTTGEEQVQLRVSWLTKRGKVRALESVTVDAAIGALRFPKRRPLSVGGKLKDGLRMPPRNEQFNGRLDNAFYRVD